MKKLLKNTLTTTVGKLGKKEMKAIKGGQEERVAWNWRVEIDN